MNKRIISIRQTLKKNYITIISAMLVPLFILVFSIIWLTASYDGLIANVEMANELRYAAGGIIIEETWDIVSGNKDFWEGTQYEQINNIKHGLEVLSKKSGEQSERYLLAAARANNTLKDYFDVLWEQMKDDVAVAYNESVMDEIRSVSGLIDEMIQNFINAEIVRMGELNRQIKNITFWIMIFVVILLASMVVYATTNYKNVKKAVGDPIDELEKMASDIASGNWESRANEPDAIEIQSLAKNLNIMASRLQSLINERVESEKNLRKAEMRTLQAQITPHFIYNTLETIVWLAEGERNCEVVDITIAFTKFLRISLSRGQDFIPVSKEIEHVKSYLAIQSIRYGSVMEYSISIDKEIGDCYVLKLLLQPLVENAIYHGVRAKRGRGHIKVEVKKTQDDMISFSVSDNGNGIESEKLEAIRRQIFTGKKDKNGGGYGLFNVAERIRLYYGASLCVESVYKSGTHISFTLPYKEKSDV